MPDAPQNSPLLDLSDLRLTPKWVTDFSKAPSRTDLDQPEEENRERRGPRDDRRGGGGGGFRDDRRGGPPAGRGERKPFDRSGIGQGQGQGQGQRGPGSGPRPPGGGDRRDDRRGGGGGGNRDRRPDPRNDRGPRPQQEEGPRPVPGISVHIEPETKATEAMAAMIRAASKAYSVFDAARLVLASGDRFHVKFKLAPDAPGRLNVIPADGSVWMSREEAISNFLQGEGINEFYRAEDVELEEPKGNFTSVAVCGMSGELLGPASHHSYQSTIMKLHREQYSDMPLEVYKRRIRTDNSPEAIAKWKEAQKHGRQWVYLTPQLEEGAEPLRLKSRAEMEAHFRTNHAATLVHETMETYVSGNISKKLLNPSLYIHLRRAVDEARKHLLNTAQLLCTGFEGQGLKLFKRRGGKLWVSRTRPRALDIDTILSTRISKIVNLVKVQPGIATKDLIEALAPTPLCEAPTEAKGAEKIVPPVETEPEVKDETVAPVPVETEAKEEAVEEVANDLAPAAEAVEAVTSDTEPAVEAPATPVEPAPAARTLTDEQVQVLKDLHWLNSEGLIIEYADGVVFPGVTEPPPAKPKAPKQPKPEQTSKEGEAAAETEATAPVAEEVALALTVAEVAVDPIAEEVAIAPTKEVPTVIEEPAVAPLAEVSPAVESVVEEVEKTKE